MEAFFREYMKREGNGNGYSNDAQFFRAYGMELLGPPLSVG
jgi:hypothetical protein